MQNITPGDFHRHAVTANFWQVPFSLDQEMNQRNGQFLPTSCITFHQHQVPKIRQKVLKCWKNCNVCYTYCEGNPSTIRFDGEWTLRRQACQELKTPFSSLRKQSSRSKEIDNDACSQLVLVKSANIRAINEHLRLTWKVKCGRIMSLRMHCKNRIFLSSTSVPQKECQHNFLQYDLESKQGG